MQILTGHISEQTAYVVEDYPYGFRLRCKIRYWLDFNPKHGVRMVSQTSNPKREGLVWNKPKASTYCRFGGCMFLDEENHVQWSGLTNIPTPRKLSHGASNTAPVCPKPASQQWSAGLPQSRLTKP